MKKIEDISVFRMNLDDNKKPVDLDKDLLYLFPKYVAYAVHYAEGNEYSGRVVVSHRAQGLTYAGATMAKLYALMYHKDIKTEEFIELLSINRDMVQRMVNVLVEGSSIVLIMHCAFILVKHVKIPMHEVRPMFPSHIGRKLLNLLYSECHSESDDD